jgi:hypothetical protein
MIATKTTVRPRSIGYGNEACLGKGNGNVLGDKTKTVTVAETGFVAECRSHDQATTPDSKM